LTEGPHFHFLCFGRSTTGSCFSIGEHRVKTIVRALRNLLSLNLAVPVSIFSRRNFTRLPQL